MQTLSQANTWPPPYKLRISKRAHAISLKICPKQGLEIVIPKNLRHYNVPLVLEEKKTWIEKNLAKMFSLQKSPLIDAPLPTSIYLNALDETTFFHYQLQSFSFLDIHFGADKSVTIKGNIENIPACKKMIKEWLTAQARKHLLPWLFDLSTEYNLPYHVATIGDQNTLWGSCSAQKKIRLNCKLLFLPPLLVRHVLLHELCHTVHLNHSKSFWHLFKKHDPLLEENRRALRKADKYLPHWLE